ncbi:glycoside hydrolase family 2 protein [Pedobacter rhodius]|uniref:beta-galactosidase n=1 Tax=Pedobacter rhodius TaxID=3004098 RepID=A0ABT4KU95_9SPHI|nr:glycoside hydrolase family 2 TIM barrel-domain containing protein [Pedobacter sp. SJ11]MCZ4222404.1 glycoside hydrolase family 2 [Pedobacter sp. SJ11]
MMKKLLFMFPAIFFALNVHAQDTQYQYLSGKDKDHMVTWDFMVNTGMKSGVWSKIGVPSNWEQQGFGSYNYYKDTQNPEETGQYKYKFNVSKSNAGKAVFIVFEAAMTDAEVKINGKLAGPIHQGGFYTFQYNITSLLNFEGENLLEVRVSKQSADPSVNRAERKADFWLFGGIFRPVYLKILPKAHLDRIAIDAKANGGFSLDAFTENAPVGSFLKARVQKLNGENVGTEISSKITSVENATNLKGWFKDVKLWSPESPNLYQVVVSLSDANGKLIHRIKQKFGFRTAELRAHDGFYVNNKKIIFKGVNRHSEWPESGRALSKTLNIEDVKLIKEMNMNAVRMSHYPPDPSFLDACDSLGLFVIDELTGWQAKYDTEVGTKLVKELVTRDVNHPSIVIWANGNEGGFNYDLDHLYAKYDNQSRLVIHPWEKFNGTDTKHYPDYNYVVNSALYGKDVFFPTEFMHGLHDGGHGAGLDDFWSAMMKHPYAAGGFLWSFADEGVTRLDRNGKMDIQGNAAPDGILGPHREKEGSFYTIKEIWSPVQITLKNLPVNFDGKIPVENQYFFTNLNQCRFEWRLAKLPAPGANSQATTTASGKLTGIGLMPGDRGLLSLPLPASWKFNDVLYLTAFDPYNKEIFTWSWPIKTPTAPVTTGVAAKSKIQVSETNKTLSLNVDGIVYNFDKKTGYIQGVTNKKSEISISGGPALAGVKCELKEFKNYASGDDYIVEPVYNNEAKFKVKWIFSSGKDVKLDYEYSGQGEADFMGITFNYPEENITGMKWAGNGPYRVWKNRLKGTKFGVWDSDFNNTITGESWKYPEFKGYYSDVYWVTIKNKQSPFTVYTTNKGTFFQMLKPLKAAGATNNNTTPPFPDGDLGFLDAISPIGTKFQSAEKLGPQSQKNMQLNYTWNKGSLWFDFN